jgi:hypothetical protein
MAGNQIRASQLITTYGPGSMVDLPAGSVMVAGLDYWNYDPGQIASLTIDEPRLVERLKIILAKQNLTLRQPPPAQDDSRRVHTNITGFRFPQWFIVQNAIASGNGWRKRRLVHISHLDNNRFRDANNRACPVVPVRFVRACRHGHIWDVDWPLFVHQTSNACHRDLWIEERGTSGDLSDIWIVCECGRSQSMSQAARSGSALFGICNGKMPWLGPQENESCAEMSRLLIRTASNAYFPQTMSVISIPDFKSPVDDVVRSLWDNFLAFVQHPADLAKERTRPSVAQALAGISDQEVMDSIKRVRHGGSGQPQPVKSVEFEAFSSAKIEVGQETPEGIFHARALPANEWTCSQTSSFENVVLVHRLREVVAQVGFTRFEAAGTDIQGELSMNVTPARLAKDADWLPAIENRGEGIFIQFKKEAIDAWLARHEVQKREAQLQSGFNAWLQAHPGSQRKFPGVRYYFLHSFSHLLLTSISLECGYPTSALKERTYFTSEGYGVLVYTGSSDAEGTLGGLVMAGRDIKRHLNRAFEQGRLCSNDPVCAFHSPKPLDHQPLLGSACHGCLLISETSCEQHNEFLDRALVVPTVEMLGAEFFPV